jgi:lysophospholipase L1-like esterase
VPILARHLISTKRLLATTIAFAVFIVVILALVRPNSQGSAATTTSGSTALTSKTIVLYLDIGASVSVGVQPTPRDPRGQPTNRGYSNRLVTIEAAKGLTLKLTELGCPGESIATMLHGPDPCYVAPDTQLSDAVAFLHTHHNAVTLVTVDLGFNTLDVCLHHLDIDLSCVTPQLALLRQQLGQVMRALTRAAGPNVTFIGLGHYNPYLTKSTKEGAAEVFAGNSVVALRQMNRSLSQVYGSFKVPIADIATAFHEQDSRVVHISKKEATTVNVKYECKLTWMCAPKPFGPNIHPNDSGYLAIANAIAAVLPPKL